MSEMTRRDALSRLALAFAAAGTDRPFPRAGGPPPCSADHIGGWRHATLPKALTTVEFRTLERLTDLIIPSENGKPGAGARPACRRGSTPCLA